MIEAVELGDPSAARKVLVVGCIHGNECAGVAIARRLERMPPPKGVDLWLVESLNPDGVATGYARQRARRRPQPQLPRGLARLGGLFDSGARPLSEPESRIAYRLILRLRPGRLDLVPPAHVPRGRLRRRRGAGAALRAAGGLPFVRLSPYPGSVSRWENHALPGKTAFVVELPAGRLTSAQAARFAASRAGRREAPGGRVGEGVVEELERIVVLADRQLEVVAGRLVEDGDGRAVGVACSRAARPPWCRSAGRRAPWGCGRS